MGSSTIKRQDRTDFTKIELNYAYGTGSSAAIDIDSINMPFGYFLRIVNGSGLSGTFPPLGNTNSCLLIGMSEINSGTGLPMYGVQLAFGFGADKICMRHATYSSSGSAWGEWTSVSLS